VLQAAAPKVELPSRSTSKRNTTKSDSLSSEQQETEGSEMAYASPRTDMSRQEE